MFKRTQPQAELLGFFEDNGSGSVYDIQQTTYGRPYDTDALDKILRANVRAGWLTVTMTHGERIYSITRPGKQAYEFYLAQSALKRLVDGLNQVYPFFLRFVHDCYAGGQEARLNQFLRIYMTYWHSHLDPQITTGRSEPQIDAYIMDMFTNKVYKEIDWCLQNERIKQIAPNTFILTPGGLKVVKIHKRPTKQGG